MRKQQEIVVEDMVISESCPSARRIFTGGKSVLELPFTISFNAKGNYNVRISEDRVMVEKVN